MKNVTEIVSELFGELRLLVHRKVSGETIPVEALAENDGTIRMQLLLASDIGVPTQARWRAETTGEAAVSMYGKVGGVATAIALEVGGTQKESLYGVKADGSTLGGLLIDAQRLLRTRPFEPWKWVVPLNITPGAGYLTAYTAPAGTNAVLEFEIVTTGALPLIDVHLVPSGGVPGLGNAAIIGGAPISGGIPIRQGSYVLQPGGTVQARNTAGGGNTATLWLLVEEFSTGDFV